MEIYKPGETVFVDKNIQATILSVTITINNAVLYTCAWWNGAQRCEDSFLPSEIDYRVGDNNKRQKIGFIGETHE